MPITDVESVNIAVAFCTILRPPVHNAAPVALTPNPANPVVTPKVSIESIIGVDVLVGVMPIVDPVTTVQVPAVDEKLSAPLAVSDTVLKWPLLNPP